MGNKQITECKGCGDKFDDARNVRHDPTDGWLSGIDAIKETYYGFYGFCSPGCQMSAIMKKLKIKEVKL